MNQSEFHPQNLSLSQHSATFFYTFLSIFYILSHFRSQPSTSFSLIHNSLSSPAIGSGHHRTHPTFFESSVYHAIRIPRRQVITDLHLPSLPSIQPDFNSAKSRLHPLHPDISLTEHLPDQHYCKSLIPTKISVKHSATQPFADRQYRSAVTQVSMPKQRSVHAGGYTVAGAAR